MEEEQNISQDREDQQVVLSEQDSANINLGKSRDRGNKKKGKSIIFILIIIIIVSALAGGAWYLLREPEVETATDSTQGLSMPETRTPTSTPVPTVEPKEEIAREDVKIQVLNGTGIAGEAGVLQKKLESLGYAEIDVDNADNQDNSDTLVTFSRDLPDTIVDEITKELEKTYTSVKVKQSGTTQDYDVIITSGLRAGQSLKKDDASTTKTSTPTPTAEVTTAPTPTL